MLAPSPSKLVIPSVAAETVCMPTTVTVTFVPTTAEVTEVVTVGAPSTVNVAIALSVGNVRVRLTWYTPAASVGTLNCMVPIEIPPVAFTVIVD